MWACNVENKTRSCRPSVVHCLNLIFCNKFCSSLHHLGLGEHTSSAHQQQQQNIWAKQCTPLLCSVYCFPSVFHLSSMEGFTIFRSFLSCSLPPSTLQISLIRCTERGHSNICVSSDIAPGTCPWVRDCDSLRNVDFFFLKWKHVYLSGVCSDWWCCHVCSECKRLCALTSCNNTWGNPEEWSTII